MDVLLDDIQAIVTTEGRTFVGGTGRLILLSPGGTVLGDSVQPDNVGKLVRQAEPLLGQTSGRSLRIVLPGGVALSRAVPLGRTGMELTVIGIVPWETLQATARQMDVVIASLGELLGGFRGSCELKTEGAR